MQALYLVGIMIKLILGPLLKMVGFDYKNKRAKDRVLLSEFLEILPVNGDSIDLLKNHDMGDPVPVEHIRPLNHLSGIWNLPDKEFQVKKLQKLKVKFLDALDIFLNEYSKKSAMDIPGFLSIGMHDMEGRREMIQYKENLNTLACEAYNYYEEFIVQARREI
jgi:hypothetical protein